MLLLFFSSSQEFIYDCTNLQTERPQTQSDLELLGVWVGFVLSGDSKLAVGECGYERLLVL